MADNYTPGAGPVWTPAARLAGFIKRTICYIQNMKALCIVDVYFLFFPHCNSMGAICCHGNQFLSDHAQNLMQPYPHPNDASDKILLQLAG